MSVIIKVFGHAKTANYSPGNIQFTVNLVSMTPFGKQGPI